MKLRIFIESYTPHRGSTRTTETLQYFDEDKQEWKAVEKVVEHTNYWTEH